MRVVRSKVKGHTPAVSRMRVYRESPEWGDLQGTVAIIYSKPELPLWDIKGRLWVARRLRAMKREDAEILNEENRG